MRIGILGGSFDPPHNGHLALALSACKELKLSFVYMLLSPQSPFKKNQSQTEVTHRIKMLSMAIRGKPKLKLNRMELTRKGPSYTVETLLQLQKKRPGDQFFLIMGSDAWAGFSHWKKPDEILRLSSIVIGRRPRSTKIQIQDKQKEKVSILKGIFPNVSSTDIRLKINNNIGSPSLVDRDDLIPLAVMKYIQQHHLYETTSLKPH